MEHWNTGEWLGLIAIVVAAILGVAGLFAMRAWGTRRGKLLVTYSSTGLLAVKAAADKLKVTFDDNPVDDPHLVSVLLKNIGPRDITREHFDGRSLVINLNCPLHGVLRLESSDGGWTSFNVDMDDAGLGIILIEPTHIPKGTELVIDCIVSGPANPEVGGRLVEADIVEGDPASSAVIQALSAAAVEGVVMSMPWPVRILAELFSTWRR